MKSPAPLSRREADSLVVLARFRFLTRSQLQAFLFSGDERTTTASRVVMTRRILKSLIAKGLASRTNRSIGGPAGGSGSYAYFITLSGIRSLDDRTYQQLPRRLPPRGTFLLRHALTTVDVALAFQKAARHRPGHALLAFECDWEAAQRLGQSTVVPDAYLLYASDRYELHAFVEVDLGTAGSKFFARKITRYLSLYRSDAWRKSYGLWPTVLVLTPTEIRSRLLRRTTETVLLAQSDRGVLERATEFAFADLPTLLAEGPLARIWEVAGYSGRQALLEGETLE